MLNAVLVFLIIFFTVGFIAFFVINVSRKLYMISQMKNHQKMIDEIMLAICGFTAGTEEEYKDGLDDFIKNASDREQTYLAAVDEFLLKTLEDPAAEHRERLIGIAERLGFTAECIIQISSRTPEISHLGSRRAGLYKVREAVKDMEAALDFFSSENQYEILMSLARMGEAEIMQRAFEKIKKNILINELGIIEILSYFPEGKEKNRLFRNMLHSDTNYLKVLFLKALNSKMAKILTDDIIQVLLDGNKDVRAASVCGIAKLGKKAPADALIRALEDKDWEVRALAAKALGFVRTPEASLALFKALCDQQWWVRQNAANALTEHPNYDNLFILAVESGDEYARDSVLSALENRGNPVLLRSLKIMGA